MRLPGGRQLLPGESGSAVEVGRAALARLRCMDRSSEGSLLYLHRRSSRTPWRRGRRGTPSETDQSVVPARISGSAAATSRTIVRSGWATSIGSARGACAAGAGMVGRRVAGVECDGRGAAGAAGAGMVGRRVAGVQCGRRGAAWAAGAGMVGRRVAGVEVGGSGTRTRRSRRTARRHSSLLSNASFRRGL
jgi:hypothetical protein